MGKRRFAFRRKFHELRGKSIWILVHNQVYLESLVRIYK